MRETSFKMEVNRWPYGLNVEVVEGGLLLKPQRKARAGWAKRFRTFPKSADELAQVREFGNEFDQKGWEW